MKPLFGKRSALNITTLIIAGGLVILLIVLSSSFNKPLSSEFTDNAFVELYDNCHYQNSTLLM